MPDDHDETDGHHEHGDEAAEWLNPGVLGIGAASLFSDSGHELATALLPTFVTTTLHAGPAALGTIEGVSDALIGLSKLAGGPLSNDPAIRARVASGGYVGTALATGALGLATAVWQVAILRGLAWVSRGLRSPARDSLLMSMSPRSAYGRAAGLERAGDNAGAVIGPLLAFALVGAVGIRHALLLSVIPGMLAALAITIAVRQARRTLATPQRRRKLAFNVGALRRAGIARTLAPMMLFELGNLAATLLILRATDLLVGPGRDMTAATSLAILLYAGHNAVASVMSLVGGRLIDATSPRAILLCGAVVYAAAYGIFAIDQGSWQILLVAFALAGTGIGFAEPAQSAAIGLLLPDHLRGSGYAVLGLVQSIGDLGATLVAGVLWTVFSPTVAMLYAAAWMVAAAIVAIATTRPASTSSPSPETPEAPTGVR